MAIAQVFFHPLQRINKQHCWIRSCLDKFDSIGKLVFLIVKEEQSSRTSKFSFISILFEVSIQWFIFRQQLKTLWCCRSCCNC